MRSAINRQFHYEGTGSEKMTETKVAAERSSSSSSIRAVLGWPTLLLADRPAYRHKESQLGVDDLKIAHVAKDKAAIPPIALH